MRSSLHVLAAIAVSSLAGSMLGAQQVSSGAAPVVDAALVAGAPVRVHVAGLPRIAGTLIRLDADSVQVSDGGRLIGTARSEVTSIDVKSGGRSRGAGAVRGAVIGLATGGIAGAISTYATYEPCPEGTYICLTGSRASETALGAMAGGLFGAAIGAVTGAAIGRQRWRHAALSPETRVGLIASPSRVGVTLRI